MKLSSVQVSRKRGWYRVNLDSDQWQRLLLEHSCAFAASSLATMVASSGPPFPKIMWWINVSALDMLISGIGGVTRELNRNRRYRGAWLPFRWEVCKCRKL
jgi:hypothetical protein